MWDKKNWSGRKNDQLISQVSPFHTGRQAGFPTYPNGPITIVQKQQATIGLGEIFYYHLLYSMILEKILQGGIKKFLDTCLF